MVSINAINLRPMTDPIVELFSGLHRLMMCTTSGGGGDNTDHKRRVVDQFRRRLFDRQSSAIVIKREMRKVCRRLALAIRIQLVARTTEPVDMNLGYTDFASVLSGLDDYDTGEVMAVEKLFTSEFSDDGPIAYITYEQLAVCIDYVLRTTAGSGVANDTPTAYRPPSRLFTPGMRY
jgi:hypothetical protein